MMEVKLECKNVSCEKIANRLSKFRGTFPFRYKVWVYKDGVFAYFRVESSSDLNEPANRLKRIKEIEFTFSEFIRFRHERKINRRLNSQSDEKW